MAFTQRYGRVVERVSKHAIFHSPLLGERHSIGASLIIATSHQIRPHMSRPSPAIQTITRSDGDKTLAKQRLGRPLAPHLAIYKWQTTSVLSTLQRITGVVLSGGFYIFGFTYLASTVFGWGITSASMAATFGAWPLVAKFATKFCIAFPFMLHGFNGIRYLIWDFGKLMTIPLVIQTGLAAVAAATISSAVVAFLY